MIQIFGTKKCNNTAKAIRFFKERNIKFHFVDLSEKGLSRGELVNISKFIPIEYLIDTGSKLYEKLNLKYMKFDYGTVILENPLLIHTPIVRFGKKVCIGHNFQVWTEIASLYTHSL
jgi:arsenate reductase (glutaredoxin)